MRRRTQQLSNTINFGYVTAAHAMIKQQREPDGLVNRQARNAFPVHGCQSQRHSAAEGMTNQVQLAPGMRDLRHHRCHLVLEAMLREAVIGSAVAHQIWRKHDEVALQAIGQGAPLAAVAHA